MLIFVQSGRGTAHARLGLDYPHQEADIHLISFMLEALLVESLIVHLLILNRDGVN